MDVKFYTELDALYAAGATREIEDFLTSELRVAEMNGDYTAAVTILNELMGFYRVRHEYEDCKACCQRVLQMLDHVLIDEEADLATVYLNVATSYRDIGEYEAAEPLFAKVDEIYHRTLPESDFRVAALYNNISMMYANQQKYEEAYAFLCKAIESMKMTVGNEKQIAISLTNMAYMLMDWGKLDEAMEKLNESLQMFEVVKFTGTLQYASALAGMGELYSLKKDYYNALEYFNRAANVIRNCLGGSQMYQEILTRIADTKRILGQ